jgi:N-acetylglutamate synthase-like GNAT family acetyltransferase
MDVRPDSAVRAQERWPELWRDAMKDPWVDVKEAMTMMSWEESADSEMGGAVAGSGNLSRPWLRPGRPEDAPALQQLMAEADMYAEVDPLECLVADTPHGVIGFARVEFFEDVPYLRPVVVAPPYQGHGVGRRLVEGLLADYPGLCVVSRGKAAGFYQRLGFQALPWSAVAAEHQEECDLCPERSQCCPVGLHAGRNEEC